jgi:hypothetical protein
MRGLRFITLATLLAPAIAFADDDQAPMPPEAPPPAPATPETTETPATPPPPVIINNNTTTTAPPPTYVAPVPAAEGVEVADAWNAPMFVASATMFAASYGGSVIVAAGSGHIGDDKLYYPVVGPWLDYNDRRNCDSMDPNCSLRSQDKAMLIIDGVVQGVAAVGLVSSFLFPTHHTESTRTASVRIVPSATASSAGLTVLGRF